MKIVYNHKTASADIEFENKEYAFIATKFLHDIKFYGKNIQVFST